MGNQNIKGSQKNKSNIDLSQEKKSRTNWKAGQYSSSIFLSLTIL